MTRRLAAVVVAALLVPGLALPAVASAHGGILLGAAVAGPYRTQVMAAPLVERGRPPSIDVTVYLSDVTSSEPIEDATVRTTVTADGRTVRPRVEQIAGGYEAIVPVKDAFTVGQQTIRVDIAGARGTGQVVVRPQKQDGGPPTGFLVATGVVLVALMAGAIVVRRRREADWPADPDDVDVDAEAGDASAPARSSTG